MQELVPERYALGIPIFELVIPLSCSYANGRGRLLSDYIPHCSTSLWHKCLPSNKTKFDVILSL